MSVNPVLKRIQLLTGEPALRKLGASRVAVFGIKAGKTVFEPENPSNLVAVMQSHYQSADYIVQTRTDSATGYNSDF